MKKSLRNYIIFCVTIFISASSCILDNNNSVTVPGDDTLHVQETQTIIQGDYSGLKVGNSWVFQLYQITRSYRDSSFRFITVTGNIDSIWYLSIKDSIYYSYQSIDSVPKVIYQYDTCIQNTNIFQCNILKDYFRYHDFDSTRYNVAKYNDSVIPYYKYSTTGIINSEIFYVKDIGPCKLYSSHSGASSSFICGSTLLKFNGKDISFTNLLL